MLGNGADQLSKARYHDRRVINFDALPSVKDPTRTFKSSEQRK